MDQLKATLVAALVLSVAIVGIMKSTPVDAKNIDKPNKIYCFDYTNNEGNLVHQCSGLQQDCEQELQRVKSEGYTVPDECTREKKK